MTNSSTTFRQNLALVLITVLIMAVFAEIVLRIALPPTIKWRFPQESYIYDADIGHWLKPEQRAFTHDKIVTTNTAGIRDAEYSSEPGPHVYRILALGDSQTFGNGLDSADTWPKQLEAILNRDTTDTRFEVLNCGLPASDTWQHEIILTRMLGQYHPHAVVLAFYVNDVSKRFTPKPHEHEISNTLTSRAGYILKRSALLSSLRTALSSVKEMMAPSATFLRQEALLGGVKDPVIEEGWKQVELSLSNMKRMSDQHNVLFIMASLPRRDQVFGHVDGDAYNGRLLSIAQQYQITATNMLPALQQSYKEHGAELFIPWDGHNSKIANRIIAQGIAGTLVDARTPAH